MGMPTDARAELLAGHELMACLRGMDRAYISAPRTGELTRHISLRQIDPYALNQLREKGDAKFKVPEVLFDIDHPGYYDRRIKSVQVTIPCVAGPYAPVTGTLTLVASGRRKNPKLGTEPEPDPQGGASIALSSSRSDSGLFELSSQDPLYLPFEGMGAVSTWTLTLPQVVKNFDYWSIADVVLTMQYTAKRGSDGFGNDVSTALKNALNEVTAADGKKGIYQLVSMRHELPDLWYHFKAGEGLSVELTTEILPFMLRSLDPSLVEVAGKIRMAGNDVKALAFQPPAGASPLWTLEPLSELPAATKVEDITLFASFKL